MAIRFVSTHWNNCVTKQLQKHTEHSFTLHPQTKTNAQLAACHLLNPLDVLDRSLSKLTNLIHNQSLSSEIHCTSFTLFNASNLYPQANEFLNAFGLKIKKLTLVDNAIPFDDLKILLLKQTPNLEYLALECSIVFKNSPKNSTDITCSLNPPTHLNLRIFKVEKNIPENILLEILESSPKLKQVDICQSEYLHLLVQPVNRLDLLKTVTIHMSKEVLNSLEIVGNHHNGNWALKNLYFYNDGFFRLEKWGRALTIVRSFLESASVSLNFLFWSDMNSFAGLQLVQMLKVERVELQHKPAKSDNSRRLNRSRLDLGNTFPNMKMLSIQLKLPSSSLPKRPHQFWFPNFFSDITPVYSVTEFYLGGMHYDPSLLEMLPNAVFRSR